MSADLVAAYNATGAAWQRGPGRIYDQLALELVARCPGLGDTSLVLDVGAGTGAATRAIRRTGAQVVALDVAFGMLANGCRDVPMCVGDASALPFGDRTFDAVVAAFSLNHVSTPATALREAARVTRSTGSIVASSYSTDDAHPAKRAVDDAARAAGWVEPGWYRSLRDETMPLMATVDRVLDIALRAGLVDGSAKVVQVAIPALTTDDLVAWRLGMAHLAPFVEGLDPRSRRRLWSDASARLAGVPVLVRSIIVLTGHPAAQRS